MNEEKTIQQRTSRRWVMLYTLIIFALIAISAIVWLLVLNGNSAADTDGLNELNFAEVVITDLVQEEEFDGVLGSIDADPIFTLLSGTVTNTASVGEKLEQGNALFEIDGQPTILLYGAVPAFRDISIAESFYTISSHILGTVTWMPDVGTVMEQGDIIFKVDNHPVVVLYGEYPAFRELAYDPGWTASEASLIAAQSAVTIAARNLAQAETAYSPYRNKPDSNLNKAYFGAAWAAAQQAYDTAVHQLNALSGEAPNAEEGGYDVGQLEQALVDMGYDLEGTVNIDGYFDNATRQMVIRWQQDIGAETDGIVDLGEVVFLPGSSQVLNTLVNQGDFTSGQFLSVATGDSLNGLDVQQLEDALLSLGHDAQGALIADGIYTPETTQAAIDFQNAVGLKPDGILNLGEILFLPNAVQITGVMVPVGASVELGTPLFNISLYDKVIQMGLPSSQQGLLLPGDAVSVEMPDNSEVPATVLSASQIGVQLANGNIVFEILIALDDPSIAAGLDEAPVDVIVISDSVEDVMAVPVSALVALLEGGYAVELLQEDGSVRYVGVEIGFFSTNNMIEIISLEIQPGDQVVIP